MKSGTGEKQPKLRGKYGYSRKYLHGSLTDVDDATLDSVSDYEKFCSEKEFYELKEWMPEVTEWFEAQDGSGGKDEHVVRQAGYEYTEEYFHHGNGEKQAAIIKILSNAQLTNKDRSKLISQYVGLELFEKNVRRSPDWANRMWVDQVLFIKFNRDLSRDDLKLLINKSCETIFTEKRSYIKEASLNIPIYNAILARALFLNEKEAANEIMKSLVAEFGDSPELILPDYRYTKFLESIIEKCEWLGSSEIFLGKVKKSGTQIIGENLSKDNVKLFADNVSEESSNKIIEAYNKLNFSSRLPTRLEEKNKRRKKQLESDLLVEVGSDLQPSAPPPLESLFKRLLGNEEPSAPPLSLKSSAAPIEYSNEASQKLLALCSQHRKDKENSAAETLRLIREDADVNYIENGETPLGAAAKNGNAHIAKILIEHGASIFTGLTHENLSTNPLVLFAVLGRKETVNAIIYSERTSSEAHPNLEKLNDLVREINYAREGGLGKILNKENAIFLSQYLSPDIGIRIAQDFNSHNRFSQISLPQEAHEREMHASSHTPVATLVNPEEVGRLPLATVTDAAVGAVFAHVEVSPLPSAPPSKPPKPHKLPENPETLTFEPSAPPLPPEGFKPLFSAPRDPRTFYPEKTNGEEEFAPSYKPPSSSSPRIIPSGEKKPTKGFSAPRNYKNKSEAEPDSKTPTATIETQNLPEAQSKGSEASVSGIVFPQVPTGGLRTNVSETVFPQVPTGGLQANRASKPLKPSGTFASK